MKTKARVAVVTGGGSGIGAATTLALAAAGVRVAVADIVLKNAQTVADQAKVNGGSALAIPVNVTDPNSVQKMKEGINELFGPIDILINNAGICPTTPFLDINLEEWNKVLAVNLTGAFLCTQALLPDMIENRWGRVINISSLAGQVGGLIVGAHYTASKGALLALTRTIARTGAPYGITANSIAPGTVETPMRKRFSPGEQEKLIGAALVKRVAEPDEITAGILYLVSDEAAYVTGQTLNINGGAFMM